METAAAMQALNFMIGDWDLEYTVTQHGATTKPVIGIGSMHYLFDGIYLAFDYRVLEKETGKSIGEAHGIFAWDSKNERYLYHWFESSGTFLQAIGHLRDERTVDMVWQGVNCTQIFQGIDANRIYLEMKCPDEDLLLRVDFSRRAAAAAAETG
jgi:hypothetical protein